MPAAAERAIFIARRAARGETGRLCIGFSASSAFNPAVPEVIRSYRERFPDVCIRLNESNTAPLVTSPHDGKVDVAFLRPGDIVGRDLDLRMLSEEPLVVALPADHAAIGDEEVDLARLVDDRFILLSRST